MVEGAFQICNALSHSTDLHVLTTQANIQSTSTMKSRKSSAKKSWMVLNFLVSLHKHWWFPTVNSLALPALASLTTYVFFICLFTHTAAAELHRGLEEIYLQGNCNRFGSYSPSAEKRGLIRRVLLSHFRRSKWGSYISSPPLTQRELKPMWESNKQALAGFW